MLNKSLNDAASATPDPERSLKNLQTFCSRNPRHIEQLTANIRPASMLFSFSQFLATFAISSPDAFFEALDSFHKPLDREVIHQSLETEIECLANPSKEMLMTVIRNFNKKMLLLSALRDILNRADIVESMLELSLLADVIVGKSLSIIQAGLRETYGEPADDAFSVIAVGKLGGNELNFSSDIDLLYVYGQEHGETSGIAKTSGAVTNRISNHEYYCKLGEGLGRFLSLNTADGFAYRVDLRLRPEGRQGSLAMSLAAYEVYYESWGRAWERAVLLRARPVAGDKNLGRSFIDMIRAFVYRKYLDFSAIDEIRRMKTRIDETFKKDDIKRGYGGIREIEFFVQALQLIYGGKEPMLQERSLLRGLHMLLQKNLVGREDYSILLDNYLFLRRLEHRLQQLNGLQTHSIPADEKELTALSKKMGFMARSSFISGLDSRRRAVRRIYDSLFLEKETIQKEGAAETALFFSEEATDNELRELLGSYRIKDADKAIRNIHHIRDSASSFQTLRSRRMLGEILQSFLSEALKSENPDIALNIIQSFALLLASEGSYIEIIARNNSLISALTRIFSISEYLSRVIMKRPEYLELLGYELFMKKSLPASKKELRGMLSSGKSIAVSIRIFRQTEEIRLGMLFLDKKIDTVRLIKGLSKVAEAIVSVCAEELANRELAVIGMGKAGGRELTFYSDLDIIFISKNDVTDSHIKAAERLIRLLTSYTKDGVAYSVDTRLRPDGTKGPLVSSLDSFRDYYYKSALPWEIQALLKARPIAGDQLTGCCFMDTQREILKKRGREVSPADIRSMRERIQKELSKESRTMKGRTIQRPESDVYDIKLGPGGIEELEFTVQYLQLTNAHEHSKLIVQGTIEAIKRLHKAGVMEDKAADFLKRAYAFYRTLETLMRLKGAALLGKDAAASGDISEFMGFENSEGLLENIDKSRNMIRELFEKFLY